MLRRFISFFLDLLFPIFCVGCQKEKTYCCATCFKKIPVLQNQTCLACHKISLLGQFCSSACQGNFAFDGIIAAAMFKEKSTLAELIHYFKYDGAQEIGEILIALFFQPSSFILHASPLLIPVPLHKKRLNFRGFNQSLILAREINKKCGFPVQDILQRNRYTQPQVKLKGKERRKNVEDAFSIKIPELSFNHDNLYLLVDDVCTTGSTLNECAKVLKKHGAKKVFGLVIAK